MRKLFDIFTAKRRYFIVKELDMNEVMKMIDESLIVGYFSKYQSRGMTIGHCRWLKDPNLWYVHVDLTTKQWRKLLETCKEKKYNLVIKDVPDRMYFEKHEES
jgi:hypothetical protein